MSKVGRNDPCPCGSGRKYKQCHGPLATAGAPSTRQPAATPLRVQNAQTIQTALGLHQSGRKREAEALYRQVLASDPDNSDAIHFLGYIAYQEGNFDLALNMMQRSIALNPNVSQYHGNLGIALLLTDRFDDAERALQRALALNPNNVEAMNNLGSLNQIRGRFDVSIRFFEQAVAASSRFVDAIANLASALVALDRPAEAVDVYRRALAIAPQNAEAHYALGYALLRLGQLREGWQEYDTRFDPRLSGQYRVLARPFSAQAWSGAELPGKSILVYSEQGIGDDIWFAGMLPDLLQGPARGGRVIVECAPKLAGLFTRSFSGAQVVARSDQPDPKWLEGVDLQVAGGSLARYLRADLDSFPRRGETGGAYLFADGEREKFWKSRMAELPGLKVGINWRSSNTKGDRALSCTSLLQWSELFKVRGVEFVNLQYDESEAEIAEVEAAFGIKIHRYPEVDMFNDLDETAALMKGLDLVISAPTSVSVLSAALGVPTWQMNYGVEWQCLGQPNNPWYPAMKNIVRRWDEPWETVLARIAGDLAGQV